MLLELKNISKQFGEAKVLREVSLSIRSGEILGLVGENGAGKSTLMNILGGVLPPTSGSMTLDGQAFEPQAPGDSLEQGIAFIHQELNLFPNLSIAENLFLNNFPLRKIAGLPFLHRKEALTLSRNLLNQVGLDIAPQTPVERLTPAQKQLVEVAKALSMSPRLIIFDEPATSLTRHEAEKLFSLIRQLQERDIAMIYISHHLEDVMQLADRVAVLRDGALICVHERSEGYQLPAIIREMVGRDMDHFFPARTTEPEAEIVLEVKNLSAANIVRQVNFSIRRREVVGFYGLIGAGRSEMARMIYGLDFVETGDVRWKGRPVLRLAPDQWIKRGVAFLTEDRREEGLLMEHNIEKNIQLAGLRRFSSSILKRIDYAQVRTAVAAQAEATRVKARSLTGQMAATLSGGNQQKVVLAKWLLTEPELLILDEPTKGIDIGAKQEIYRLTNQLVAQGSSVLLISSEIEELIGLCDRILVMNRGRISAAFEKTEFDRPAILEAALHA